MNCPVCDVELKMTERQGVEIDYCPQCRGIWLDRGELDKIIERSHRDYDYDRDDHYKHHDRYESGRRYGKKPKSLLKELFDF